MIFDWHPFDGTPRIEGVEIAFMKPLTVVGGARRPLRIEPVIKRLAPEGERYWGGDGARIRPYYDYEGAVWLLWSEYERLHAMLPPWEDAPRDGRPIVMLGVSKWYYERASTVYWDPDYIGWWHQPGESGAFQTLNGHFHPRVMTERGFRWCEPEDVFTPAQLQADREHRERAGESY